MKKILKPENKQVSNFVRFSGLGLQMGVAIFLMNYLGQWLDKTYPSKTFNYTNILTLFAVFGTTYSVIRQVIKLGKDSDEQNSNTENKTD